MSGPLQWWWFGATQTWFIADDVEKGAGGDLSDPGQILLS